jgi:hypothetical protein
MFIPDFQYLDGFDVIVEGGNWEFNADSQLLEYSPGRIDSIQHIMIIPKGSQFV